MGEEVQLGGVGGEDWVGGRRVVKAGAQREVLAEQLHVVLYPL